MQKLMKNWVFTLIVCILLAALAILMFLSGFKVGGLKIGNNILKIVAAAALTIYTVLAIAPLAVRYRGALQGFAIGECAILLVTALALVIINFGTSIPLLSNLDIFSVVGLALWLRGVVETVHAYLSMASSDKEKRLPLWRLLLYILMSAVGVWQLVSPILPDKTFVFVVAGVATVMAVIFACATYVNRRAGAEVRRAKKAEKAKKKAEKQAAKAEEMSRAEAAELEKAEEKKALPEASEEPAPTAAEQ
jgi:Na+-transporting methylmalonyl-CoA/oxaloacetate decarboxylase gamma subunit